MIKLQPWQWPKVTGMARPAGKIPVVRWGLKGGHLLGRLNTAAMDLIEDIVKPPDEIGIITHRGVGEDAGKFALEVVVYPRTYRDPRIIRLMHERDTRNTTFSAGALAAIQPSGQSILERREGFLIGNLGDLRGLGRTVSHYESAIHTTSASQPESDIHPACASRDSRDNQA